MEAFGRMIAIVMAVLGGIGIVLVSKQTTLKWQKRQMVRHITYEFAENVLSDKKIMRSESEWFEEQLRNLGQYEAQITVFERKRFEDGGGRKYLYEEKIISEEENLYEGSYFRITVTERNGSVLNTLLYGPGLRVVTGGRIS